MTDFEDMGRRAFKRGINAPALDPEFMKAIPPGPIGSAISHLNAWNRGWGRANIDEPLPPLSRRRRK